MVVDSKSLGIEGAGHPGALVEHLAAIRLPHQAGVVLELVVVVGRPGHAVAVGRHHSPLESVVGRGSPERYTSFTAPEERVAHERAIHELLAARGRHFLSAVGRFELTDVNAERAFALGQVDVERGVFEQGAGLEPFNAGKLSWVSNVSQGLIIQPSSLNFARRILKEGFMSPFAAVPASCVLSSGISCVNRTCTRLDISR